MHARRSQHSRISSFFPGLSLAGALALVVGLMPACSSGGGAGPVDAGKDVSASGGTSGGSGGATGSGGAGSGGVVGSGGSVGSGGAVTPPDGGDAGPTDAQPRDAASEETSPPAGMLGQAGGACPGGVYGNPLPANTTATLVRANLGGELEGPVWVASQKALYFAQGSGTAGGRIHKYTPAENKFEIFAMNVGIGGLAVDTQGTLIVAAYDVRKVVRIDPATGVRTDVPGGGSYMGQAFNEVNDVTVRADGNIYFSDPRFGTPPGTAPQSFYRLSPPPTSTVTRFYTSNNANGVAISPDGAFLYVSTSGGGGGPVRRFALNADGSVNGAGTAWKEGMSDGMGVDCAGNIYLSVAGGTNQIQVLSPTDETLGTISGLGGGYVTNSAFGDEDRKTLYITTSLALYKIQLNVPGFPN